MRARSLYIGLLSGTSMDGIDTALVDLTGKPTLLQHKTYPIPHALRNTLQDIIEQDDPNHPKISEANIALGKVFAAAVNTLLEQTDTSAENIIAIGSHGQTIGHHPNDENPYSLQIGHPQIIADKTGITTVADFRTADIEAGGQGAPLAPLFHSAVLSHPEKNRAVVNVGGIANITLLNNQPLLGFDTGPGNGLMDAWIFKHKAMAYDENGDWANSGTVNTPLLQRCLADPYFKLPTPKSTGKEYFNLSWLEQQLDDEPAEDVQASLLELTAKTIVDAIPSTQSPYQIILCGGGAHNKALTNRINTLSKSQSLTSTELSYDSDYLEAMLFAYLAELRLNNIKLETASITGATSPVLLGEIYQPIKE